MLMTGATVTEEPKSISAAKPSRGSGQTRGRRQHARSSANVIWKRMNATFEELKKHGANPALVAPLTRWVVYNHLTPTQGMAGRRYADIIGKFERFTMTASARSPRSANLEPSSKGEDDEIERVVRAGTIGEYEADARHAKRQYKRLMKVLDHFKDPITGRNVAKDHLDTLCLSDQEPPAQLRRDIAIVLSAIAKEFGLGERRRKVQ
jgi:hypothetical protein